MTRPFCAARYFVPNLRDIGCECAACHARRAEIIRARSFWLSGEVVANDATLLSAAENDNDSSETQRFARHG